MGNYADYNWLCSLFNAHFSTGQITITLRIPEEQPLGGKNYDPDSHNTSWLDMIKRSNEIFSKG